jgi:hypothetical protein
MDEMAQSVKDELRSKVGDIRFRVGGYFELMGGVFLM